MLAGRLAGGRAGPACGDADHQDQVTRQSLLYKYQAATWGELSSDTPTLQFWLLDITLAVKMVSSVFSLLSSVLTRNYISIGGPGIGVN